MLNLHCSICKDKMNTKDPLSLDCGGDCMKCMAIVAKDPDCISEVMFRLGFRKGVEIEGGGAYEYQSESIHEIENQSWLNLKGKES